ncbi:MAG: hypoxanthine phosphoribosyltransferase [Thermoflexales bacterium]|nr:hypoxanthine phosphoribosyltransferase [Thermoflexales bacterium]
MVQLGHEKIVVDNYVAEVLISAERLQARLVELGAQISTDYAGLDLVLVCILKGGVLFLTDLMRQLAIPHEIDFLSVMSYGSGARQSSGAVRIQMDLATNIAGRDVLIVEDIIDSGRTLEYIVNMLGARAPASLKICTLLDKVERREVEVPLAYVGFQIPDKFVFGYGLDLDEKYRNLPFIGVIKGIR